MIFWIASYPKSGNTWIRTMIAAYYFSNDGNFNQSLLNNIRQFPEKNFFKGFNYDPKIVADTCNYWIKAQEIINKENKVKFFKTHNILGNVNNINFTNKQNTIGGIYIVRDPRNVITSLKNHYEIDYDEAYKFISNEKKYIYDDKKENDYSDFQIISSWEKNYQSWIKQKNFNFKLIRYEDLQENTIDVFKQIIDFINDICNLEDKFNIQKAKNTISTTIFSKLKQMEKKDGFNESVISKKNNHKIPFFNMGPNNNWKKILPKKYQELLRLKFMVSLQELNYL